MCVTVLYIVYVFFFTHYVYLSKLEPKHCRHASELTKSFKHKRVTKKWLFFFFFSMVTSSKPAHSMPHHRPVHLPPHSSACLAIPPSALWPLTSVGERRGSLVAADVCKAKVSHCTLSNFTSLPRQSSPRSWTCRSGVGALRVAWVRRRWSLLRDKRKKNSLIILLGWTGRCGEWKTERKRKKKRRKAKEQEAHQANRREIREARSSLHWKRSERTERKLVRITLVRNPH